MPRSAGHRPGRTAMAAGGQAGRGAPRAGGRLSAPQPRAPARGALGAHSSGLRSHGRPVTGRTRRVAPLGTQSAAMQPGRSAATALPRTQPAAVRSPQPGSGPARASKPGMEYRSGRWQGGAGEERRGRAAWRCSRGPPPVPGVPPGGALGSPGDGLRWWEGRPPTAPRDL